LIQGKRIFLRAPEPDDVDLLYKWENNTALWRVSNTIAPFSRFAIEQYVLNAGNDIFATRQLRLMICLADQTALPIGAIDLFDFDPHNSRAGVGIVIIDEFRNLGYASEALGVLIDYCFQLLGIHQLYCNISADNATSIRLFEEAGFINTGLKKSWIREVSTWKDELFFQKINKTFN
jgi:diamine N-acetyltransferase